jgi:hypothetical protein
MDFILEQWENAMQEYKGDTAIIACLQAGWEKLVKYYRKTDDSAAYAAAVILNPALK